MTALDLVTAIKSQSAKNALNLAGHDRAIADGLELRLFDAIRFIQTVAEYDQGVSGSTARVFLSELELSVKN